MNLFVVIFTVIYLIDAGYTQECVLSDLPPTSNSGCCGRTLYDDKTSSPIARIGEYPWMGIVEYKKEDKLKLLCSAVLISGRYALSAGSCFSTFAFKVGTPVSVRLGEYDVNNDGPDCVKSDTKEVDCTNGAISIPIDKFTTHPDYNINNSRQNDITLIRLLRMVPYSDFIRPICMPSLDITLKAPKNLYMTVTGWGAVNATVRRSNVLRQVHVPYVDFYLCRHKYNMTARITLTNGHLCAGSKNRDACQGDSGGPLMLLKGQTTELAGIVSFGPTPCGQDKPGVYTKVFAYNEWVKMTIETDLQMLTTEAISTSPVKTTTATKFSTTIHDFNSDLIVFRD